MKKIHFNVTSFLKPLAFSVTSLLLPWYLHAEHFTSEGLTYEAYNNYFGQFKPIDLQGELIPKQDTALERISTKLIHRFAKSERLFNALREQMLFSIKQSLDLAENFQNFFEQIETLALLETFQLTARDKLEMDQPIDKQWLANVYILLITTELNNVNSTIINSLIIGFSKFVNKHFIADELTTPQECIFIRQALLWVLLESEAIGHSQNTLLLIIDFLRVQTLEKRLALDIVQEDGVNQNVDNALPRINLPCVVSNNGNEMRHKRRIISKKK